MAFFDLIVPDLWYLDKDTGQWRQLGRNYTPLQSSILSIANEQVKSSRPIRIICLKARQMGCSTITQAMMAQFQLIFPNTRGLTMAHRNDSAEMIHQMLHGFWMRAPRVLHYTHTLTSQQVRGIGWDNRSSMHVATAGGKSLGRGGTIRAIHNSELAFYENASEIMGGLDQSCPRAPTTIRVIESTANGVGNLFHNIWEESVADLSRGLTPSYHPLFFAWWQHPYYTADHIGLGDRADQPLTNLTGEEKILVRALKSVTAMDDRDIRARLIWRREILKAECRGDLQLLHQEYPSTPEESFIATGLNVFNLEYLARVYKPMQGRVGHLLRAGDRITFHDDPTGPVTIYVPPSRASWYTVGGDPSRGPMGDYAVCSVIDRHTWEQVATYRRRGVDSVNFAEEMLKLGVYYNQALLAPEVNLSGHEVAGILRTTYDNLFIHRKANKVRGQHENTYGWVTNTQTKYEAIGNLQRALLDSVNDELPGIGLTIHCPDTYAEMRGYVNVNGKYQNGRGTDHDDTVMAHAIAVTATMYDASELFRDRAPSSAPAASTAFAHVTAGQMGRYASADEAASARGLSNAGVGVRQVVPPVTMGDDGGMEMDAAVLSGVGRTEEEMRAVWGLGEGGDGSGLPGMGGDDWYEMSDF